MGAGRRGLTNRQERPVRTCVGCRRRATTDELVRVVADVEGRLQVGRTRPGRGAWLCAATVVACAEAAARRRAFARALRRPIPAASVERLTFELRGGVESQPGR